MRRRERAVVERAVALADDLEELAERAGDVEIIVERGFETPVIGERVRLTLRDTSGAVGKAREPFVNALERFAVKPFASRSRNV